MLQYKGASVYNETDEPMQYNETDEPMFMKYGKTEIVELVAGGNS